MFLKLLIFFWVNLCNFLDMFLLFLSFTFLKVLPLKLQCPLLSVGKNQRITIFLTIVHLQSHISLHVFLSDSIVVHYSVQPYIFSVLPCAFIWPENRQSRLECGHFVGISFSHKVHIFVSSACLCARVLNDPLRLNICLIIDTFQVFVDCAIFNCTFHSNVHLHCCRRWKGPKTAELDSE